MDEACFERFTGRPPRQGQCAATARVVESVESGKHVVLEAPTGTGKTLIAVAGGFQLLERGVASKILLVAHTKLLQKQHERELKRCAKLQSTWSEGDVAVLYGKSNYICRLKLSNLKEKQAINPGYIRELTKAVDEFVVSNGGKMPTFDDLSPPPRREDWHHIACGGDHEPCKMCEHAEALCQARVAKVVVINQTLLWCISQFARHPQPQTKDEDWRDYLRLNDKDTVVMIDEAHEIETLVSDRKTWTISIDRVLHKLNTFVSESFKNDPITRVRWEKGHQQKLESACNPLLEQCYSASKLHYRASEYHQLFNVCHLAWHARTKAMMESYVDALVEAVNVLLDDEGPYRKGLLSYVHRKLKKEEEEDEGESLSLQQLGATVPQSVVEEKLRNKYLQIDKLLQVASTMNMSVAEYTEECDRDDTNVPVADAISIMCDSSFENGKAKGPPRVCIRGQPLTVSSFLKDSIWNNRVWNCKAYVCMSATITIEGRFESFLHRNGLPGPSSDVDCFSAPCVFDYANQMEIQVSPHQARSQDTMREFIQFVAGSESACLLLFTSNSRLHEVSKHLHQRFRNERVVMRAGEDVDEALKLMNENPRAVVCGCKRYWTGVDVPTLGLVCIDAMPYSSDFWPRKNLMGQCGSDAQRLFQKYYEERMLQQAIQGMGRLVRTPSSKGKVFIADTKAAKFAKPLRHAFPDAPMQYVGKRSSTAGNNSESSKKAKKR